MPEILLPISMKLVKDVHSRLPYELWKPIAYTQNSALPRIRRFAFFFISTDIFIFQLQES